MEKNWSLGQAKPRDARARIVPRGASPLLGSRRACSLPAARPGTRAPAASVAPPGIPAWASRAHYDGALLCTPGHHLYHVLGSHRHRRALVCAERTQPRSDHHHAGGHGGVLLPLLAHRHPGSAEPPVWAPAEERDHLVCALPVGVTDHRSGQVPRLSG